jgi:ketosteroid isomerase-like protein
VIGDAADRDDLVAVGQLEASRVRAISDGDVGALADLLTEDYQHVHATGARTDKQRTLQLVAARPRTIKPRDPDIRLYGDIAVLNGLMVNLVPRDDGTDSEARLEVTQVARRTEAGWRFCSFHVTALPDQ